MTNDDLLLKYFDGALSPGERAEFDNRVKSSPEFAEEVRAISALEDSLGAQRIPINEDTERFLAAVGVSAIGSIPPPPPLSAPAGASGSAGGAGFLGSKAFLGLVSVVVGGGIVASSIAYFNSNSGTEPQTPSPVVRSTPPVDTTAAALPPQATLPQPEAPAVRQTPAATDTHAVEPNRKPATAMKEPVTPPAAEPITRQRSGKDGSTEVITQTQNNDNYSAEIDSRMKEYRSAEAKGEKASQAFSAKQLGILYRDTDGKESDARTYLETAIRLAHDAKLTEVEAQAHGELGLLEKKIGNRDRAIDQFQRCIDLMHSGNIQGVEKWTKELDKIRNN